MLAARRAPVCRPCVTGQPSRMNRSRVASHAVGTATALAQLDAAVQGLASHYAVSDAKIRTYEKLCQYFEDLIHKHTDAKYQRARLTIGGSFASGTATCEEDTELTMRTHESVRVSRAESEMILQAIYTHLESYNWTWVTRAKTSPSFSTVQRTEDNVVSWKLVFERSNVGEPVTPEAPAGMYPLPPTVCSVVRILKLIKFYRADTGFATIKSYLLEALVMNRYETLLMRSFSVPSVLETLLAVLQVMLMPNVSPETHLAELDSMVQAAMDADPPLVPSVPFTHVFDKGQLESARNESRRLFDSLAKVLRKATTTHMTSDGLLRYLDSQLFNKPFDPSPLDVDGLTQQLQRLRIPERQRTDRGDIGALYTWLQERSYDFPADSL